MSLSDLTCTTPQAGDAPLSTEQAEKLQRNLSDWSLAGAMLQREFRFKEFREAMVFVNQVAKLAEQQAHHPDIFISCKAVRLNLTTHKVGGLSLNDFIVAARVNKLAAENRAAAVAG